MTTATSSSERYEAARKALATYDHHSDRVPESADEALEIEYDRDQQAHATVAALRALLEPDAVNEGPEEIAERVINEAWGLDRLTAEETVQAVLNAQDDQTAHDIMDAMQTAVRAGIQAAWESWEPDDYAPVEKPTVTAEQYDGIIAAIDQAKNDDRPLDSDEYAGMILDALGVTLPDQTTALVHRDFSSAAGVQAWTGSPSAMEPFGRECDNCGGEAQYLSSRDRCDACEALPACVECGQTIDDDDIHSDGKACGSCLHDAERSGA